MHFMSLRTGTFLILLTQLINKITAFYGILALATGFQLDWIQLSMYIYSLFALAITLYVAPHIRSGSAWHCLAFAQSYAVDTLINAVYTAAFSVSWFSVMAASDYDGSNVPGSGIVTPTHNVSQVDVVAKPAGGIKPGQDAVAVGSGTASAGEGLASAVFNSGSMMSMFIIVLFWALRIYAVFVVMMYARQVLRQHIQVTAASNWQLYSGSKDSEHAENPFAEGKEEGKGLRGKIGRVMVSMGRDFWLGRDDEDDTWIRMMGGKFRKSNEGDGNWERERRRRAGTDPPLPPDGLLQQP
jgi:inositol phosphorylceramide synthase regulatory subunit